MFSARRKPKRIARDEPERSSQDEEGTLISSIASIESDALFLSRLKADSTSDEDSGPVVRRPNLAPKTKSKLRTSFAPDEAEDSSDAPVIIKAKPRLGQSSSSQHLPRFSTETRTTEDTTSRPSYSKSALDELRNSTPSTPKDLTVHDPSSAEEGLRDLDLASKFGPQPTSSSAIPSAAEIAERKSRRARLAQEQKAEDFIPLDDDTLYDSDGEFKPRRLQVGTYRRPDPTEKDTRLLHDDEDILEGFDDYTEDAESSRITMGRKQLLQAQRRDREAMRDMIDHAEGGSSGSSNSDSEAERNHAYETAQTSHGMDGLSAAKAAQRKAGANRPRQPREITPVPKLGAALGKLRERIAKIEIERVKIERRREEVRKERAEIVASQEHIQRSLMEAGEELERVMKKQMEEEKERDALGVNGGGSGGVNAGVVGRGLDSMGLTPEPT